MPDSDASAVLDAFLDPPNFIRTSDQYRRWDHAILRNQLDILARLVTDERDR